MLLYDELRRGFTNKFILMTKREYKIMIKQSLILVMSLIKTYCSYDKAIMTERIHINHCRKYNDNGELTFDILNNDDLRTIYDHLIEIYKILNIRIIYNTISANEITICMNCHAIARLIELYFMCPKE